MQRVMIIGCGGAGKSWMSGRVAERTGLPVIHLDSEYWQPGWVATETPQWRARMLEMMQGYRWIIDGNYGSTLSERLAAADTVIFLDFSTIQCLYGVFQRLLMYRGRTRPDITPGCPERLNVEFLLYVLSFRRRHRRRIISALKGFDGRLITLASRKSARRFLRGLDEEG